MPLEGLRWSRDSGSALCDTSQNSRSRTGWGGERERYSCNILLLLNFTLSVLDFPFLYIAVCCYWVDKTEYLYIFLRFMKYNVVYI